MGNIGHGIMQFIAVLLSGFLLVAIIATLVGSNAQTSNVISTAGSAFSSIIGAAVAPVSGGSSLGTTALANSGTIQDFSGGVTGSSLVPGITGVTSALSTANSDAGSFDPTSTDADFGSFDPSVSSDDIDQALGF